MNKKLILIGIIAFLVIAAGSYFIFFNPGINNGQTVNQEKQLWTCGMHPDIIMEEPGNCPICGMKLVPMKVTGSSATGERKILYYRSPMNPTVTSEYPGKDEMGMDYVPVYDDESGSEGIVSVDPVVVQNMNVKTVKVEKRKLNNMVVTNGVLSTNEKEDYSVTTRVNGWVNKLYINYTGQKVSKGEKLLDIYSPELVAAQQELLTAISYKKATSNTDISDVLNSGNELIKTAVRKLQLLEMSDSDIDKLQATKEVKTYITQYAQRSGTVISKNIIEGQKIMPGMSLLQISNLSILWLTADIYEYELAKISLGSKAEIKFNFMPGKVFQGKINFIYPTIDSKTRTAKIRIDMPNNNDLLKPAMLANLVISGIEFGSYPVIPENAVLRGGKKDVVILALGNGKFKPQQIQLGAYSDGYYQVLNGLSEGAEIVTSAQFMIDSESNLRSAVNQYTTESSTAGDLLKNDNSTNEQMEMDEHKNDAPSTTKMNKDEHQAHNHKTINKSSEEESIVRDGIIDLRAIDKNKDGKVFQDFMDWNVISDKEGRCPLCDMKLQEVTLEQAAKNLIEHDFEVK